MSTSNDPGFVANAGAFLSSSIIGLTARQLPSANESRGDYRLDEALKLANEYESVIDSKDREAIEDSITYARQMKSGLEAKWGISRFLQARDYRRAATHALRFANAISDRVQNPTRISAESYFAAPGAGTSGATCPFGFGISDPRCLLGSDPTFDSVISVAKPLYRSYLSCNDAFPTPSKKDEWAAIVWCEASVRAGKYPGPLFRTEWFTINTMTLLSEMKTKLRHAVETLYEFSRDQTPGSLSYNMAHADELLTKMAFIYREHNSNRDPLHKYQHPIIQKAINILWFKHKDDDGMTFQEHFSPIPIPAMALVLTVTQCCIDEWTDGTRKESNWDEERFKAVYRSHLEPLNQIHESGDPLEDIRRDLLRNASDYAESRDKSDTPDVPDAEQDEDLPAYPGIEISVVDEQVDEH